MILEFRRHLFLQHSFVSHLFISILLAGCTTTVLYKSAEGEYSATTKIAIDAYSAKLLEIQKLQTKQKAWKIADAGDDCNIINITSQIWLLEGKEITPYIQSTSNKTISNCQKLIAQETAFKADKKLVCFHDEAVSCLNTIESQCKNNPESTDCGTDHQKILPVLLEHKFGGTITPDVRADMLKLMSEYLDHLSAIADGKSKDAEQSKSLSDQAKGLVDRTKKVTDGLQKIKPNIISSTEFKKTTDQLQAAADFFSKLQTLESDYKNAKKLAEEVVKNQDKINGLFNQLIQYAKLDDAFSTALNTYITVQENEISWKKLPKDKKLETLYSISNGKGLVNVDSAVAALFEKAKESHNSLIQLIQDPTPEQNKKARQVAFDNFKEVAGDLIKLTSAVGLSL